LGKGRSEGKGEDCEENGKVDKKRQKYGLGTTKGTGKVGKGKGRRMYGECREGKGKN